ncbi:MAG TPA: ABC transporter ATP-binding protein [Rectinemataceae bacterium]|nr:ABC transporter ATP-binding protein [Rectinemataceae bacterium]
MAVLELSKVARIYRKGENEVRALDGVDLSIEAGEFLAIVGPSGSGKTTMLNILGCLDSPTSGTIVYDGTDLHGLDEKALSAYRRDRISFVFQSYNLIPVLTVRENVELPLVIEARALGRGGSRGRGDKGKGAGRTDAEIKALALEMIEAVGLSDKADRFPREISGGQEQRVAIARALVKKPLVVLADEPTANLDSHTAGEILDLMRDINEKKGATFIFSTHDRLVMDRARRIVTLHDGKIVSDTASPKAIDDSAPGGIIGTTSHRRS